MADDEQFSLCWNNFNSNLSAGFHESLCRGDLVDVTLAAEGQFVKAHRLVLSVCSPYFRKMFTQMPANQHAFVFLKDVSHSALKDLIQFMYCGEVNVKQDALPAFISTAEALQIKGLTDGEPAPSQSPAKPSTPAPQQTIPAPSMSATSPRVRTQRSSTTRTYKLESEDSGDDKQQIVLQTQTQPQQIVQQQKRPAQRSITPHSVPSVKRVKNSDPLEATDPTQITVQTVSDNKSTSGDAEFIDLPMDLPTKSEPDYAEDAGEVETAEQETTYVEDDSYGDMKYDESYFTENDETAAATTAPTTSGSTTVKAQTGTFSESYVSDTGDQSATEAQGLVEIKKEVPVYSASSEYVGQSYPRLEGITPQEKAAKILKEINPKQRYRQTQITKKPDSDNVNNSQIEAATQPPEPSDSSECEHTAVTSIKVEPYTVHDTFPKDAIPLHAGSKIYVSKSDLMHIFTPNPKLYVSKLTDLLFKDLLEESDDGESRALQLEPDRAQSIITHVVQVFKRRGEPVSEEYVRKFLKLKLYRMTKSRK